MMASTAAKTLPPLFLDLRFMKTSSLPLPRAPEPGGDVERVPWAGMGTRRANGGQSQSGSSPVMLDSHSIWAVVRLRSAASKRLQTLSYLKEP